MALDNSIFFRNTGGAGVPSLMDALNSGIQASQAIKQAPLMNELMRQKVQAGQMGIDQNLQAQQSQQLEAQKAQKIQAGQFVNRLTGEMLNQSPSERALTVSKNADFIRSIGEDPTAIDISTENLTALNKATSVFTQQQQQAASADERNRESLAAAIVGQLNPKTGKPFTADQARATVALIDSGVVARAGSSAAERAAQDSGLAESITEFEAGKSGAIDRAKTEVRTEFDLEKTRKANSNALKVYESAMQMYSKKLGQTSTGTIVGLIPAITSNQKSVEGAKSVLLPVLKSIFRGAGEGTFTDKDQDMLVAMLPDRTDTGESASFKLEMLNSVIMNRLGVDVGTDAQNDRGNTQQSIITVDW